ncbi:MAG: YciI family protein, partial [Gemmatimonadaceae bacterium]
IRSSGGKLQVIDGPFTETKEVIGGYALVETKSREEADAVAREFMELHRVHWPEFECVSEVRRVEDM